jgi:hypothetical protein
MRARVLPPVEAGLLRDHRLGCYRGVVRGSLLLTRRGEALS